MPFTKELNDLYKFGIVEVASQLGVTAVRVDEQLYLGSITGQIIEQIRQADLVVAEVSDRNANVMYELGFAEALEKVVLLLSRTAGDLPFDTRDKRHILHEGSLEKLRTELAIWLPWALGESKRRKELLDVAQLINRIDECRKRWEEEPLKDPAMSLQEYRDITYLSWRQLIRLDRLQSAYLLYVGLHFGDDFLFFRRN
jgi:hypothetical protein